MRIDRKRKIPATVLLKALGLVSKKPDEIINKKKLINLIGDSVLSNRTLDKDLTETQEEALIEIYKKLKSETYDCS